MRARKDLALPPSGRNRRVYSEHKKQSSSDSTSSGRAMPSTPRW
jgi:hypothetical protein